MSTSCPIHEHVDNLYGKEHNVDLNKTEMFQLRVCAQKEKGTFLTAVREPN